MFIHSGVSGFFIIILSVDKKNSYRNTCLGMLFRFGRSQNIFLSSLEIKFNVLTFTPERQIKSQVILKYYNPGWFWLLSKLLSRYSTIQEPMEEEGRPEVFAQQWETASLF